MGTSTSSSGGRAGSPLDPAWLPADGAGGADAGGGDGHGADSEAADGADQGAEGDSATQREDLAPSRRFAPARTSMSTYLRTGDKTHLGAAIGSAVRRGMGGPQRAASTMRRTAQGAAAVGQVLRGLRERDAPQFQNLVQRFQTEGLSIQDLILEVIKEALPSSGSIDEDSVQDAATEALSEFFEKHPDADPLALSDDQIQEVVAVTIANDIMHRLDQQLGQTYERLKLDPVKVQVRRNEAKEYVKAVVQVEREKAGKLPADLQTFASSVLASALEVFSEP
jgi:hypothetical protein